MCSQLPGTQEVLNKCLLDECIHKAFPSGEVEEISQNHNHRLMGTLLSHLSGELPKDSQSPQDTALPGRTTLGPRPPPLRLSASPSLSLSTGPSWPPRLLLRAPHLATDPATLAAPSSQPCTRHPIFLCPIWDFLLEGPGESRQTAASSPLGRVRVLVLERRDHRVARPGFAALLGPVALGQPLLSLSLSLPRCKMGSH